MCGVIRGYKRKAFLKRFGIAYQQTKHVSKTERDKKENEMRVAAIHLGRVNINKRAYTSPISCYIRFVIHRSLLRVLQLTIRRRPSSKMASFLCCYKNPFSKELFGNLCQPSRHVNNNWLQHRTKTAIT